MTTPLPVNENNVEIVIKFAIGVDNDKSLTDNRHAFIVNHATWKQMEVEFNAFDDNRVTGVVSALESNWKKTFEMEYLQNEMKK